MSEFPHPIHNPRTGRRKDLDMTAEVWTAEEVAQYLRMSARNVRNQAAAGDIPGKRIGGIWRFRRATIVNLLDQVA